MRSRELEGCTAVRYQGMATMVPGCVSGERGMEKDRGRTRTAAERHGRDKVQCVIDSASVNGGVRQSPFAAAANGRGKSAREKVSELSQRHL